MRIVALYIAIVVMAAGLLPRNWAHADFRTDSYDRAGEARIEVGLRDFTEQHTYETITEPLSELNDAGAGFQGEGTAALVAGIAAAIACAVASEVMRRRVLRGWRVALVAPQAVSLVATLVFANRLAGFGYLSLGWSPLLCVLGVVLATSAMLVHRDRIAT